MQSPNRAYVPQIDELRGIAALLVFYFHASILGFWATGHVGWIRAATPIDALLFEGHTGVALFMVLSGFILSKGVVGRPVSYGRFLKNRLLRIAPLMVLLTVFAIYGNEDLRLDHVLAPFLLLQNAQSLALNDRTGLVGTVWTISTEFQFYLVAPFLFTFVGREGLRRFLLPAMALMFALKLLVLAPHASEPNALWSIPYFSIVGRMNQFLLGVGLGAIWPEIDRLPLERRGRLGLMLLAGGSIAAFLLAFAVNRGGGQYAWHAWRYAHQDIDGVVWAAFIAGYVLCDPLRRLKRVRRAAIGIGVISFSLYLLHWAVLNLAIKGLPRAGIPLPDSRIGMIALATILILPAILGLAALSYWCVERPFLAARTRYVGAGRPDEPTLNSPRAGPVSARVRTPADRQPGRGSSAR